jgi:membrane-bound metal-dependent hydrolase YbcI (DUF457 family)
MAGFKTHVATSTVLGIGYGAAAYSWYEVPLDQCLLATGLCSVSGMLPDLDSDNGVPLRESLAFAAAVVPMLLIDRFQNAGFSTDAMVLLTAVIYAAIRFGLGSILRSYTRHRGMFHSLPAAIIFAELAYLMCDCPQQSMRIFKAAAVMIGFMSHLILDEVWSVELRMGIPRFKKSFGTALKLWDKVWWANLSAYAKLFLVTWIVINESSWTGRHAPNPAASPNVVTQPPPPGKPRAAESPPPRVFR